MEESGVMAGVESRRTFFWECGVKKLSRVRLFDIVFVRATNRFCLSAQRVSKCWSTI